MFYTIYTILSHHSQIKTNTESEKPVPWWPKFQMIPGLAMKAYFQFFGFFNLYIMSGQSMAWCRVWITSMLFLDWQDKQGENKQANKYCCVNANVDCCLATND